LKRISVLVDTSVWSEALRRKNKDIDSSDSFLYDLISNEEEIFLIGPIIQEILSGIKDNKLFDQIKNHLEFFGYIELSKEDYVNAAELRNELSKKGIAVSSIDSQIATMAITKNLYLATYDKDFKHISKYKNLKVLGLEEYKKLKK
jgi:predicted nucleic acid-binding protein